MANIQALFSTTIEDDAGDSKTLEIYGLVADTVTLAGLQTFATGTQDIIDAAVDGRIKSSQMTLTFVNSVTNKEDAVAGSDVEEGALLSFAVTGSKYVNSVFVPSILEAAKFGNQIDLANAFVAALTGRLIGASNGYTPGNRFGMPNESVTSGYKRFRK